MKIECQVCSNAMESSIRYKGLLNCEACGFKTADINISPDILKSIYGHDYFHGDEYADYINEKNVLQKNFNYRLKEILNFPGVDKNKKVFEIGCAYGFFLELLQNKFSEVAGIDISQSAVDFACAKTDVSAICGDFISTDIPFEPDIICMWDVIEHMENPDKVIEKASKILSSNGYICITTGDIGSFNARIRGENWRMIHPPTHLHYFDRKNISQLLKKHGLTEVSITYPPVIRTIRSLLSGVLKVKWNLNKLYTFVSKLPGQNIPIPLNLYDIMFVVAKKVTD